MHPQCEVRIALEIPDDAVFWQPTPSEINEEGFGYFHNVWPIVAPTAHETRRVLEADSAGLSYASRNCSTEDEFEEVAKWLESVVPDDDETAPPAALGDRWTGTEGLDLGVAGLVYSLAHVGFYPAASCRAHTTGSWADCPTVLFAAGQERLMRMLPMIQNAGCGIQYVVSRGVPLFALLAPSTMQFSKLAEAVFAARRELRAIPKTSRRSRGAPKSYQPELPI
ncbi:hypothetical protein R4227_18495 [Gordonia amicalis]|uniref:hypothetical protein n=1 Tax=Gordonia amicalis TaxID=89053 RepID=UPI00295314DC|nr:hypothetical protein [Gordonia amicalis]MDV7102051.1 hypothetical protein [Gordonia amicalis]